MIRVSAGLQVRLSPEDVRVVFKTAVAHEVA
jgi:hypothetical protein